MKNDHMLYITGMLLAGLTVRCDRTNAAEVRKAAIEFGAYQGNNKDPYILLDKDGERLQHISDLILNTDLACTTFDQVCIFWDNTIASKASEKQYRSVEWRFRLGVDINRGLEMGYRHSSIHELDSKSNNELRFPLENVIFMQFKFIDRPRGVYRGY